jgi:hypothetical protein
MANIALILNVCIPLIAGGDDCQAYIVETYPALMPCIVDMEKNRQRRDDRYLSCGAVDRELLTDNRDGRTVPEIIADLNKAL